MPYNSQFISKWGCLLTQIQLILYVGSSTGEAQGSLATSEGTEVWCELSLKRVCSLVQENLITCENKNINTPEHQQYNFHNVQDTAENFMAFIVPGNVSHSPEKRSTETNLKWPKVLELAKILKQLL